MDYYYHPYILCAGPGGSCCIINPVAQNGMVLGGNRGNNDHTGRKPAADKALRNQEQGIGGNRAPALILCLSNPDHYKVKNTLNCMILFTLFVRANYVMPLRGDRT
jgi:hypothetical protein